MECQNERGYPIWFLPRNRTIHGLDPPGGVGWQHSSGRSRRRLPDLEQVKYRGAAMLPRFLVAALALPKFLRILVRTFSESPAAPLPRPAEVKEAHLLSLRVDPTTPICADSNNGPLASRS